MRPKTKKTIPFKFRWLNGVELSKIKADIVELEGLGVNYIDIYTVDYGSDTGLIFSARIVRFETDNEVKERIKEAELQYERERSDAENTIESLKKRYNL